MIWYDMIWYDMMWCDDSMHMTPQFLSDKREGREKKRKNILTKGYYDYDYDIHMHVFVYVCKCVYVSTQILMYIYTYLYDVWYDMDMINMIIIYLCLLLD